MVRPTHKMDSFTIYAIVAGASLSLFLVRSLFLTLSSWANSPFWKTQAFGPLVLHRRYLTLPVSPLEFILQLLYFIGTALYNVIGVNSLLEASSRASDVASFNFVVLLFGDRLAFAADILDLSRQTYRRIHQTIGTMTVLQMIVKIVFEYVARGLRLQSLRNKFDLIVSISCLDLSLTYLMSWCYLGDLIHNCSLFTRSAFSPRLLF